MILQLCTSAVHSTSTDIFGIAAYRDGTLKVAIVERPLQE